MLHSLIRIFFFQVRNADENRDERSLPDGSPPDSPPSSPRGNYLAPGFARAVALEDCFRVDGFALVPLCVSSAYLDWTHAEICAILKDMVELFPKREILNSARPFLWAAFFRGPIATCLYLPGIYTTTARNELLIQRLGIDSLDIVPMRLVPGVAGCEFVAWYDLSPGSVNYKEMAPPALYEGPLHGGGKGVGRGHRRTPERFTALIDSTSPATLCSSWKSLLVPKNNSDELKGAAAVLTSLRDEKNLLTRTNGAHLQLVIETERPDEMPSWGPRAGTYFDQTTFPSEYARLRQHSKEWVRRCLSHILFIHNGYVYCIIESPLSFGYSSWEPKRYDSVQNFGRFGPQIEVEVVPGSAAKKPLFVGSEILSFLIHITGFICDPKAPSLNPGTGVLNHWKPYAYHMWEEANDEVVRKEHGRDDVVWMPEFLSDELITFLREHCERLHGGNWEEAWLDHAYWGWVLTHPGESSLHFPVFVASHGCGKTTWMMIMRELVGYHVSGKYDSFEDLFGKFTAGSMFHSFHFLDEGAFVNKLWNRAQTRVTSSVHLFEPKGREFENVAMAKNYVSTCNEIKKDFSVLPGERRLFLFGGMTMETVNILKRTDWRTSFHGNVTNFDLLAQYGYFVSHWLDLSPFTSVQGTQWVNALFHSVIFNSLDPCLKAYLNCLRSGCNNDGATKWEIKLELKDFASYINIKPNISSFQSWISQYPSLNVRLNGTSIEFPALSLARSNAASTLQCFKYMDSVSTQTFYNPLSYFESTLKLSKSASLKLQQGRVIFKNESYFRALVFRSCDRKKLAGVGEEALEREIDNLETYFPLPPYVPSPPLSPVSIVPMSPRKPFTSSPLPASPIKKSKRARSLSPIRR